MRKVSVQEQILDLLFWVKEEGFWPERFKGNEWFVIPMTGKMGRLTQLKEHQRCQALWVPSESTLRKVLRKRGIELARFLVIDGVYITRAHDYRGAGVGTVPALLSVLNDMRKRRQIK